MGADLGDASARQADRDGRNSPLPRDEVGGISAGLSAGGAARRLAGDLTGTRDGAPGSAVSRGVVGAVSRRRGSSQELFSPQQADQTKPPSGNKNGGSGTTNNLIQGNKEGVRCATRDSGRLIDLWRYRPRGVYVLDLWRWFSFFRAALWSLRKGRHARA